MIPVLTAWPCLLTLLHGSFLVLAALLHHSFFYSIFISRSLPPCSNVIVRSLLPRYRFISRSLLPRHRLQPQWPLPILYDRSFLVRLIAPSSTPHSTLVALSYQFSSFSLSWSTLANVKWLLSSFPPSSFFITAIMAYFYVVWLFDSLPCHVVDYSLSTRRLDSFCWSI